MPELAEHAPPPQCDAEENTLKQLTDEQATALRSIDMALRDCDALGWHIEQHCREYREWDKGGEQRLEWQAQHADYCRLIESKIERQLSYLGASGDDLYALLADVCGGDTRADSFLKKLLAMGDYAHYCDMMRWLGRVETRRYTTSL